MHGNASSDLSWNKCWNVARDNFMMALQCPVATPRKELLQDSKVQVPRKSWSKVSDEFVAMIPRGHGRDMLGFEMAHIHCHNFCCCFKCFTLLRFLSVVVCLLFGFGFVAVVVLFVASLTFIFLAYLSLSHPVAGRAIRVTLVCTIKSTIRQITRFSGWLPVWLHVWQLTPSVGVVEKTTVSRLVLRSHVKAYLESLDVALPESEALFRLLQNSHWESRRGKLEK